MFNIDWPDLSFGPINLWNAPKLEQPKEEESEDERRIPVPVREGDLQ